MISTACRLVAGCILCFLAQGVAFAQSDRDRDRDDMQLPSVTPTGPVTTITDEEFDRMVRAGTLVPATPQSLAAHARAARERLREDTELVESYLRQHPELIDLARLARLRPDPDDPNVKRNANGTYAQTFVGQDGATRTITNFGHATKMMQLATSIRTATDRDTQLRHYTDLYSRLPQGFIAGVSPQEGVTITRPLPPSQLQNASLDTILNALDSVASQWPVIVKMIPHIPVQSAPLMCPSEVGANAFLSEIYYGDEVPVPPLQSVPAHCSTPDPKGIYGNFDFSNKGALTCVKDQGTRGTCGVFAATSAIEELIALNTGTHVNLSEQDYWEQLTLLFTTPPELDNDGYDAGFAIKQALLNQYRFAYERQWDYNPAWDHPSTCTAGSPSCYANTCDNYPAPPAEPACSNSSPQATQVCLPFRHGSLCGFAAASLPARSPYALGPGMSVGASLEGDVVATGTGSVVGSVSNLWNPSGLTYAPGCTGCPPVFGGGPHPNLSVGLMILALVFNETVILGFEETSAFGPSTYVPFATPSTSPVTNTLCALHLLDLCTDAGGHNIHVVGFVANEELLAKIPTATPGSGGGYFILKNSWGPCAGDVGFYYMPVDYVKARAQSIYAVAYGG
jgi:hypothetical protein